MQDRLRTPNLGLVSRSAAFRPLAFLVFTAPILFAGGAPTAGAANDFDSAVKPVLGGVCKGCHNTRLASGGLDLSLFLKPDSIVTNREEWEKIVNKLRTGEMPPRGIPHPAPAQTDALVHFVEAEFGKADALLKPDPGRVTARRLNRNEYSNSIRDLLGVEFHAERDFPTDDSGSGFDNIADVLTVSPLLMEKYLGAAEVVAARAVGADPLPKKPLEIAYHTKDKTIRRLNFSLIEATHRVEWDADYVIRVGLPGQREADSPPVTLGFWMDGKLLKTIPVETKPSKLVYFDPYSEEQIRLFLPEGDHVFRAGFIDDPYVNGMSEKDAYNNKKNKFLNSMVFVGPYPSTSSQPGRRKIFICDPESGPACVEKIVSALARRAWRRPVTAAEVASLMKFVNMAKAEGQTTGQGIQVALEAILVSPQFLFRIERDPAPLDPSRAHPVSDLELASRLSYFLWSSLPDGELLGLAESGKLRAPGTLDAQVKRMLADPRSAALADNFAGQWLETRNLDVVKPDPAKFPEWTPELRDAMKTESRMFFDYMLRENRPLEEFLDARYTFLNEKLAKYYGIDGVKGPDFRKVDLPTGLRGGILGEAGVLTVSSYPTRTSVVIRGKYILSNILGTPPPPPPADVPALDDGAVGTSMTLRQTMEKHRANAVCASCHSRMDPLGFGLENYDAIGRWRTKDGKFDVDSSGTLPDGRTFQGPIELRAILKQDLPGFTRCLAERMLTYALGRGLERYDNPTLDEIQRKLAAPGAGFQSLVYEIVRSLPFESRRGERPPVKPPSAGPKETASR